MKRRLALVGVVVLLCAIACGAYTLTHQNKTLPMLGMVINYLRYLSAPAGTIATEVAPAFKVTPRLLEPASATMSSSDPDARGEEDWPSYNRTLTSNRFSQLNQINRDNVGKLKVLCTYDTGQYTGFSTGLIKVDGALIGTTAFDIFSIDPANCRQNWRTHESYEPAISFIVNRGAAYMNGRLFRGTQDGRVLAYDFKTGNRLWATIIADSKKGETVPAAPIAWNGLVFIGNAGGDLKGVKGRMYALDAVTGKVVWEFYLVPKSANDITRGRQGVSRLDTSTWGNFPGAPITGGATWTSYTLDPATGLLYVPGGNPAPDFAPGMRKGSNLYSGSIVILDAMTGAYKDHFKLVPRDWHDWDVSSAPAIIQTAAGKKVMSVAPKDGHLYGFDLATKAMLYRTPVTRIGECR